MVERFAILLVALDPTRGSELQKTRPCVVVSPSEINVRLRTVVIAPITGRLTKSELLPKLAVLTND